MVCSICSADGHTKKNCPTMRQEDSGERILLPADVTEKFKALATMCDVVASDLGKGHVEGVYQQALCVELQENDVRYVSEETIPILYKGIPIGGGHSQRLDVSLTSYLPGFIFELKAVSGGIKPEHHCQLMRYMVYKRQHYGAVVNFCQSDRGQLEIQFIVLQGDVYYLYNTETGCGTPMRDFELSLPHSSASVSTIASTSLQAAASPSHKPRTLGELRRASRASSSSASVWSGPSIWVGMDEY